MAQTVKTNEELYEAMIAALKSGKTVVVSNYMHAYKFTSKHTDYLRLHNGNVEFRTGKSWFPITGAAGLLMKVVIQG